MYRQNDDWADNIPPAPPLKITAFAVVRIFVRAVVLCVVVFGCLGLLLCVRLFEVPLHGPHRPWTPRITQFVCKCALVILQMKHRVHGYPIKEGGAIVANHIGWVDIFAYNARQPIYFVSKSDVAHWPGIGWLARATGTVFINRKPSDSGKQNQVLIDRLKKKHLLLFFPEGTTSDGARVLKFKSTLFEAFFAHDLSPDMLIQPVSAIYTPPSGEAREFYGWWGDMGFASHLLRTLSPRRNGAVDVWYHDPVRIGDFSNRKDLCAYCEGVIKTTFEAGHPPKAQISTPKT